MTKPLFNEFDKVTPNAWKQKIQVDLNGDDYNNTLLTKTNDGITIKPFYTKEDRSNLNAPKTDTPFNICQTIVISDAKTANKSAKNAVLKGATALRFKANKTFNYTEVLNGVFTKELYIYFNFTFLDIGFIEQIYKDHTSNNLFFQLDPIGNFAETGNWFKNFKTDTNLLQNSSKTVPNIICITADLYQNAGANIPQQLAYTLAHANEYLEILGTECYKNIHFKFAVGSNYFFEIAKLKAFRVLWQTLLKGHAINNTRPAHIFATPSLRNKTIYDYNVNLLRTTTECMSAVLGTADTVANINYDAVYANNSDFAERISKNQLLTLKHEAHFNNAKQVADGSYYIDAITTQLAEKSLDIFKLIEKGGGFIKQLKEGVIQRKIKESHTLELQQFNSNSLHLLGTNLQLHKEDAMANNLQFNPFPKKKSHKTIIAPITRQRIAANMEAKRLKEEKNQI